MTRRVLETIRLLLIAACAMALAAMYFRAVEAVGIINESRRAEERILEGMELRLEGRPEAAAAAFHEAIDRAPKAAVAYLSLARLEFARGRTDRGVRVFRRLLEIYPYMYFSHLHRELGSLELRAGRVDAAAHDLARAVELNSSDWLARYLLGHAHARRGDIQSARAEWRETLRLRPDYEPAREDLRKTDDLSE